MTSTYPTGSLYFGCTRGPLAQLNQLITGYPFDLVGIILQSGFATQPYVYLLETGKVKIVALSELVGKYPSAVRRRTSPGPSQLKPILQAYVNQIYIPNVDLDVATSLGYRVDLPKTYLSGPEMIATILDQAELIELKALGVASECNLTFTRPETYVALKYGEMPTVRQAMGEWVKYESQEGGSIDRLADVAYARAYSSLLSTPARRYGYARVVGFLPPSDRKEQAFALGEYLGQADEVHLLGYEDEVVGQVDSIRIAPEVIQALAEQFQARHPRPVPYAHVCQQLSALASELHAVAVQAGTIIPENTLAEGHLEKPIPISSHTDPWITDYLIPLEPYMWADWEYTWPMKYVAPLNEYFHLVNRVGGVRLGLSTLPHIPEVANLCRNLDTQAGALISHLLSSRYYCYPINYHKYLHQEDLDDFISKLIE